MTKPKGWLLVGVVVLALVAIFSRFLLSGNDPRWLQGDWNGHLDGEPVQIKVVGTRISITYPEQEGHNVLSYNVVEISHGGGYLFLKLSPTRDGPESPLGEVPGRYDPIYWECKLSERTWVHFAYKDEVGRLYKVVDDRPEN